MIDKLQAAAHRLGGLLLADAARMMCANPNVNMQTSGRYREDFIEDTVAESGPKRVLFGSSAPYMDQGFEASRIRFGHADDDTTRLMGRKTTVRLCRLTTNP